MANDIPVTAHGPKGQIQSKAVLDAWSQYEPDSVRFIGEEQNENLGVDNLPQGARLSVRGGRGNIGRVTIVGRGGGFRVS